MLFTGLGKNAYLLGKIKQFHLSITITFALLIRLPVEILSKQLNM